MFQLYKTKRPRPVSVLLRAGLVGFQARDGPYGGVVLVLDPSGNLIGLPLSVLRTGPFNDFLVLGLVLLFVLGAFPLVITFALWRKSAWDAAARVELLSGNTGPGWVLVLWESGCSSGSKWSCGSSGVRHCCSTAGSV